MLLRKRHDLGQGVTNVVSKIDPNTSAIYSWHPTRPQRQNILEITNDTELEQHENFDIKNDDHNHVQCSCYLWVGIGCWFCQGEVELKKNYLNSLPLGYFQEPRIEKQRKRKSLLKLCTFLTLGKRSSLYGDISGQYIEQTPLDIA